jgi:hypothetical protein
LEKIKGEIEMGYKVRRVIKASEIKYDDKLHTISVDNAMLVLASHVMGFTATQEEVNSEIYNVAIRFKNNQFLNVVMNKEAMEMLQILIDNYLIDSKKEKLSSKKFEIKKIEYADLGRSKGRVLQLINIGVLIIGFTVLVLK